MKLDKKDLFLCFGAMTVPGMVTGWATAKIMDRHVDVINVGSVVLVALLVAAILLSCRIRNSACGKREAIGLTIVVTILAALMAWDWLAHQNAWYLVALATLLVGSGFSICFSAYYLAKKYTNNVRYSSRVPGWSELRQDDQPPESALTDTRSNVGLSILGWS